jgi:hypothetical protein
MRTQRVACSLSDHCRKEAITLLDEEEDRLNGHGGEDAAMDPNNLIFFAPAPGLVLMSSQQVSPHLCFLVRGIAVV